MKHRTLPLLILLLLAVLLVADGLASPLLFAYPLLIIGAALWFRVRFVWFMAVLSIASYGVLLVDFYHRRPELRDKYPAYVDRYDRHVIFLLALVVLALMVSYLVERVRALSTYCGQKV